MPEPPAVVSRRALRRGAPPLGAAQTALGALDETAATGLDPAITVLALRQLGRRRAVHSTPTRLTSMLWQLANTICGERNL